MGKVLLSRKFRICIELIIFVLQSYLRKCFYMIRSRSLIHAVSFDTKAALNLT